MARIEGPPPVEIETYIADTAEAHIRRLGHMASLARGITEAEMLQGRLTVALAREKQEGEIVLPPEGEEFRLGFRRGDHLIRGKYNDGSTEAPRGFVMEFEDIIQPRWLHFHAGKLVYDGGTVIGVSHDLKVAVAANTLRDIDGGLAVTVKPRDPQMLDNEYWRDSYSGRL